MSAHRSSSGTRPPVYATRAAKPAAPARMSTRSDCAKTASPIAMSNDPARAPPLTTRSQVSRFASRHQVGVWRQIDPFEREVRVRSQKRPRRRSAGWRGTEYRQVRHPPPRLRSRYEVRARGRDRKDGMSRRCAAGFPRSRGPRRSRGSFRRGRKRCRRHAPPATRQDPRSSRRRRPDAIAAGSDAVSGPGRPWPRARRSGRTRLRSCRSAVPSTARTHRPDEPGWKVAGS